jgi:hypothetical protein
VPINLCAKVPPGVSADEAAFTPIAAIALQGIRLAQPSLGETVVVTGLGLIGLLAVQLLRANGCRVIGIDFDRMKLDLARSFGAEVVDLASGSDPVATAHALTRGCGVDAVVVTAATNSSEPVHQAAQMCRKRGRIVLVGATGLDLKRSDFYEKELTFQVSCSYGPGRYDRSYEDQGRDYPVGFVRWTEQRNFEAVLEMLATGKLVVGRLISHRFPIQEAGAAYELLSGPGPSLGILLEYAEDQGLGTKPDLNLLNRTVRLLPATSRASGEVAVSFIGAGNAAFLRLPSRPPARGYAVPPIPEARAGSTPAASVVSRRSRPTFLASWRTTTSMPSSSPPGTTRTRALSSRPCGQASTCSSRSRSALRAMSSRGSRRPIVCWPSPGSSWWALTAAFLRIYAG